MERRIRIMKTEGQRSWYSG